ncbi:MAG: cell division protein FtsZ [Candidatus Liptonbacteria bacterium]|nr:cell division protein FtsZ [Candidatus Liptonbacteria bacterium]MBI3114674.1 cell division protein FtsZ [Candidatus Harrisonbacteria bacterium]
MSKARRSKKRAANVPPKEKLFAPIANVKVVGIGGGGTNAVSRISRDFVRGVQFLAVNTDHQDLDHAEVRHKIYIGKNLTRGLGTGMNPDLGRQAAEENRTEITEALRGSDLIFLTAGFGGGTGSGGAPVVAEIAKQLGALVVAVVTKPFGFEGSQRERIAQEAVLKLKDKVDALIVVPNDRIFNIINKDTPLLKAFEAIDDVLRNALKGVVELVVAPGIINLDFADVRNILEDAGSAIVGVGLASGPERAMNAVQSALNSPLLETSPEGAKRVLLGISGSRDLTMNEINEAAKIVAQTADPSVRLIFGAYHDRRLKPRQLKVTLIAAGFNGAAASSLFGGAPSPARPSFFEGFKPAGAHAAEERSPSPAGRQGIHEEAQPGRKTAPVAASERIEKKEKQELKTDAQKKPEKQEVDIWDIPTFLRRRKK